MSERLSDEVLADLLATAEAAEAQHPGELWECFPSGPKWWWFGPKHAPDMKAPETLAKHMAASNPATVAALVREVQAAREALRFIAAWDYDAFPRVPDSRNPGQTISFAFAYGSNGERDFMRKVARDALATAAPAAPPAAPAPRTPGRSD